MEAASFREDIADSAGRIRGSGIYKDVIKPEEVFLKGVKARISTAHLGDSVFHIGNS